MPDPVDLGHWPTKMACELRDFFFPFFLLTHETDLLIFQLNKACQEPSEQICLEMQHFGGAGGALDIFAELWSGGHH